MHATWLSLLLFFADLSNSLFCNRRRYKSAYAIAPQISFQTILPSQPPSSILRVFTCSVCHARFAHSLHILCTRFAHLVLLPNPFPFRCPRFIRTFYHLALLYIFIQSSCFMLPVTSPFASLSVVPVFPIHTYKLVQCKLQTLHFS